MRMSLGAPRLDSAARGAGAATLLVAPRAVAAVAQPLRHRRAAPSLVAAPSAATSTRRPRRAPLPARFQKEDRQEQPSPQKAPAPNATTTTKTPPLPGPAPRALDANEAVATVAFKCVDTSFVYPITPSTPGAEKLSELAATPGSTNAWGNGVDVREMQSESGVAGALHGALAAGSLVSTFTCSQGLLLMIPELYKLAGEALPGVLHVAARSLAGASLSIFGGHDDVLAAKQSGAAVLFSSSVQEAADQALVAHLAALRGSLPVLHAYDGFRTSHELTTIEPLEVGGDTPQGQALRSLLVDDPRSVAARAALRRRALDPARPSQRGTAQGPDVFFQQQEAANARHRAFSAEVELAMKQVSAITGRSLSPFSYVGDENAEEVVVAMGSGVAVAEAAARWLNEQTHLNRRVGVLGVRLYRPWSAEAFLAALPSTAKRVAVLERCKDVQALGEPLFLDVTATLAQRAALQGAIPPLVVGGRYGLGSKDFTPAMAVAVFDHLAVIGQKGGAPSSSSSPYSPERLSAQGHHHAPPNHGFTVGIVDDVTHTSLPLPPVLSGNPRPADLLPKGTVSCLFYGLGGDGTVGANHEAIRICGGSEGGGMRAQAYFAYGAAKSGGLTTTHMRLTPGGEPLDRVPYLIGAADYAGVHGPRYLSKYGEAIASRLKQGGTLLINTRATTIQELESEIPPVVRKKLAELKPRLFVVDARAVAEAAGLGKRVNAVLQAAFFALSGVIQPLDRALDAFKASIARLYGKKGPKVVEQNVAAVDAAVGRIVELSVPDEWGAALETAAAKVAAEVVAAANNNGNGKSSPPNATAINPWGTPTTREQFIERVVVPALQLRGDELPVSALALSGVGGAVPSGTSAIEKRGLAEQVPTWDAETCSQCGLCSFVCPHAAIRPFLATPEEARAAPAAFGASAVPLRGGNKAEPLLYKMAISPMDCTGCSLCVHACPDHSLVPSPIETVLAAGERDAWDWAVNTPSVAGRGGLLFDPSTVRGSQFHQPLLEFSGACEGCGETPYVKLLTQMAGETAVIANATGCSSIWGGGGVTMPYTVNSLSGRGPAWGNALFEDNAEFAYGIELGLQRRREALAADVRALLEQEDSSSSLSADLRAALKAWLPVRDDHEAGPPVAAKLAALLAPHAPPVVPPPLANAAEAVAAVAPTSSLLTRVAAEASMLWPLQTFAVSGDGAAYDIGAAGLEHVLADPSARTRFLVLDNGFYANTGGQASKATPLGAVAKLAPAGEARPSKELALEIAATYPHVYVATVCLEASPSQCVRAFAEAMAHKGPALIIAYTPCALQGIEGGMGCSMGDAKAAVDSGFVQLWRRAPGKRLALDSGKKEPEGGWEAALEAFLSHENRFGQLARKDAEAAARLHHQLAGQAARRRRMLSLLQQASEADAAAEAAGGDASPTVASR